MPARSRQKATLKRMLQKGEDGLASRQKATLKEKAATTIGRSDTRGHADGGSRRAPSRWVTGNEGKSTLLFALHPRNNSNSFSNLYSCDIITCITSTIIRLNVL